MNLANLSISYLLKITQKCYLLYNNGEHKCLKDNAAIIKIEVASQWDFYQAKCNKQNHSEFAMTLLEKKSFKYRLRLLPPHFYLKTDVSKKPCKWLAARGLYLAY